MDRQAKRHGGILSQLPNSSVKSDQVSRISDFVAKSAGLKSKVANELMMRISQSTDGKGIAFAIADLEDVIPRIDADGNLFLQINFLSGKKILLTENLIGFKPAPSRGLDLNKLPKVVTTPDLLSVVEAIEDTMNAAAPAPDEIDVLKRVFDSVLRGAEAVGFDITPERLWMQSLARNTRASA